MAFIIVFFLAPRSARLSAPASESRPRNAAHLPRPSDLAHGVHVRQRSRAARSEWAERAASASFRTSWRPLGRRGVTRRGVCAPRDIRGPRLARHRESSALASCPSTAGKARRAEEKARARAKVKTLPARRLRAWCGQALCGRARMRRRVGPYENTRLGASWLKRGAAPRNSPAPRGYTE